MKRIVFVALSALAFAGCVHEAALDHHLYDKVAYVRGTAVPPVAQPPAPLIDPSAQPAPPMRDPKAPDASLPAPLGSDNSATTGTPPPQAQAPSATGAPPLQPTTPVPPSPN
jgi:hypothetical protein